MSTSKRQPLYRNMQVTMSRIIEDWQMRDKVTLFGKLVIYEAILHWIWAAIIFIDDFHFKPYIATGQITLLFIGCTIFIALMFLMTTKIKVVSDNQNLFSLLQVLMVSTYSIYICLLMLTLGQDSFFTGISFMGGIIVAMLLVERKIVLWIFCIECVVVTCLMIAPFYVGELPTFKRDISEYYSGANADEMIRHFNMFWRTSYVFLGLPKVIIIVYTVRKLLDAIDYRKKRIRYHAEYDALTKLRNRRSLTNIAYKNLCNGMNTNDKSIILMDLDYFKQVNDVYGHIAGDEVLFNVAQLLKDNIPENCEIGRYGGEEFLIVLPNTTSQAAVDIANQLRRTLEDTPIDIGNNRLIGITASFGIASISLESIQYIAQAHEVMLDNYELKRQFNLELSDIVKMGVSNADRALYEAKESGRNQVMASPMIELKQLEKLKSFNVFYVV